MTPLTIENTPVDMLNSLNVLIEWYNECEIEREILKNKINAKYGTGVNASSFMYQDTDTIQEEIKAGDIIVNIHTGAIYVCTHVISPNLICYDSRLGMLENARAQFGGFRSERKNFRLYARRLNNAENDDIKRQSDHEETSEASGR